MGKGKFVYVEGRLQLRSYEDRGGRKHEVTEVVVTTLRFLGPSKNGDGAKAAESSKPHVGTFTLDQYDTSGNSLAHLAGQVKAKRITVNTNDY